jgi:hypothetical protein
MESDQKAEIVAKRSRQATLGRDLPLAGLEAALGLIDHIDTAPPAHQLVVAVATPQRFQGITDFHGTHSRPSALRRGRYIAMRGRINRGRTAFRQSGSRRDGRATLGGRTGYKRVAVHTLSPWFPCLTAGVQSNLPGLLNARKFTSRRTHRDEFAFGVNTAMKRPVENNKRGTSEKQPTEARRSSAAKSTPGAVINFVNTLIYAAVSSCGEPYDQRQAHCRCR